MAQGQGTQALKHEVARHAKALKLMERLGKRLDEAAKLQAKGKTDKALEIVDEVNTELEEHLAAEGNPVAKMLVAVRRSV